MVMGKGLPIQPYLTANPFAVTNATVNDLTLNVPGKWLGRDDEQSVVSVAIAPAVYAFVLFVSVTSLSRAYHRQFLSQETKSVVLIKYLFYFYY